MNPAHDLLPALALLDAYDAGELAPFLDAGPAAARGLCMIVAAFRDCHAGEWPELRARMAQLASGAAN